MSPLLPKPMLLTPKSFCPQNASDPKMLLTPRRPRMTVQAKFLACAVAMSGLVAFAAISPANALSMSECSAKYKEAKTAGTLNGQKWNDFRKAECGADATATPAAAPAAPPPVAETKPARAPKLAAAPVEVGNAVFTSAV